MLSAMVREKSKHLISKTIVACLAVLFLVLMGPGLLKIDSRLAQAKDDGKKEAFCSQTAKAVFKACKNEVIDDYNIAKGNCINVSDPDERADCYQDAKADRKEAKEECNDQLEARQDVCGLIGEDRYDPDFTPGNFLPIPKGHDYFPLGVGDKWVYEGTFKDDEGEDVTETITVEVLRATKLIEGVTCIVVNDVVEDDGELIEDTDDWYAQRSDTMDVWYVGEIAKNFETFEDDAPPVPELVDIDGSWKTGRDGAKPGILIEANPLPGNAYRQEILLGEAEDVAEVLSNTYVYGGYTEDPDSLDYRVPEDLAEALCSEGDPCVVTRDFTALEPGVEERKYYAPGIGVFLEVDLETGDIVQLLECTSCPTLPAP
jgi:hypothetical protein